MAGIIAGIKVRQQGGYNLAETSNIAKLPVLGKAFWKGIGNSVGGVGGLVDKDCAKGIMQNGTSKHPLSLKYRKYKANDMRRFSDGKRLGDARQTPDGMITYKTRKYPIIGKSLKDIGKSYVTMRLTGESVAGLKPVKSTKDSVTMSFTRGSEKVLGNAVRHNYDIIGLNKKNIELVRQQIIKKFRENKVKFLNKDIKIGVTK